MFSDTSMHSSRVCAGFWLWFSCLLKNLEAQTVTHPKALQSFQPPSGNAKPWTTLKALGFVRLSHANAEDDDDPEMLALIENGGDAPEGGAFL